MINLIRALFTFNGGDDSPPPPPPATSTTTVQQHYSPEEAAIRTKLFGYGEDIYNRNKSTIATSGYPGPRPVVTSPESATARNMLVSAAAGPGTALAGRAGNALAFGLGDVLYPGANPALGATVDTAVRKVGQSFTDPGGVFSGIRTNFTGGNSDGSSTREGIAMGLAGRSYLDTVGDVAGKMYSDAYGKGLDFMKSSMAFAPNMYNLMMQPAMTIGAVGTQKEIEAQQAENYAAAARNWGLTSEWSAFSPYASLVTGMFNPSSTTTGIATGMPATQRNSIAPFGMAMIGAQMAGSFGMSPLLGGGLGLLGGLL